MYSLGSLGCLGSNRICGRKYPQSDSACLAAACVVVVLLDSTEGCRSGTAEAVRKDILFCGVKRFLLAVVGLIRSIPRLVALDVVGVS